MPTLIVFSDSPAANVTVVVEAGGVKSTPDTAVCEEKKTDAVVVPAVIERTRCSVTDPAFSYTLTWDVEKLTLCADAESADRRATSGRSNRARFMPPLYGRRRKDVGRTIRRAEARLPQLGD